MPAPSTFKEYVKISGDNRRTCWNSLLLRDEIVAKQVTIDGHQLIEIPTPMATREGDGVKNGYGFYGDF
jgi:hypothetical protein